MSKDSKNTDDTQTPPTIPPKADTSLVSHVSQDVVPPVKKEVKIPNKPDQTLNSTQTYNDQV